MMSILLPIVIGIVGGFLLVYVIFAGLYYSDGSECQKISFKQFRLLSSMAPEKWRIAGCDDGVYYREDYEETHLYMKSYFDQIRLSHLRHQEYKKEVSGNIDKQTVKMIASWTKDIETYRNKYGVEGLAKIQTEK